MTGMVVDTCVVIHMIRDSPMGKRCMAALALGLPLMTADGDFDHLCGPLLEVVKVG